MNKIAFFIRMSYRWKYYVLGLLGIMIGCIHITDIESTDYTDITLYPDTTENQYFLKKRYFVLVPGDTAFLCGIRVCTTFVDDIVDSCFTESVFVRTITQPERAVVVSDTTYFLRPQIYQQGRTRDVLTGDNEIRYFAKTDSGIYEPLCKTNGAVYVIDKRDRMFLPNPVVAGGVPDSLSSILHNWSAAPSIPAPEFIRKEGPFLGYSIANRALGVMSPYTVYNNSYKTGLEVTTYYVISHDFIESNGDVVRIFGELICRRAYFKDRGMLEQIVLSKVKKFYPSGSTVTIKDSTYIGRPDRIEQYPDSEG